MSAKPDGGPAFPRPATVVNDTTRMDRIGEQPGMTLRQWYAGMYMQGIVASGEEYDTFRLAEYSFGAADDMIDHEKEEK